MHMLHVDKNAAEKDPAGLVCPTEFAEALKDCFHEADKQLLHWLRSRPPAYNVFGINDNSSSL